PFEDYAMKNRTYRYFEGGPLYPFGFGLSYSKFEYTNLKLSSDKLKAGEPLTVEVDVKNTSAKDGDEVVQVYLSFPKLPGAPLRSLRAFKRVPIKAGGTQHVSFSLQDRDLSHVEEGGDRIIAAGQYGVRVGGGQPDTTAAGSDASFSVQGKKKLPE